jgi:membrane protease YdiL (CAAX protease family)
MTEIEDNQTNEIVIKRKFLKVTKEFFLIILLWICLAFLLIALPLWILFGLWWFIDNFYTIFYLTFYTTLFLAFYIWIKYIKKRNFKDFILGRPKFPENGHCWISYLFVLGTVAIFVVLIALITLNIISMSLPLISFHNIVLFIHLAVGAPIVEEIIFRGYLYYRCEELYGGDKKLVFYKQEKEPFRKLHISYAALISSFFFGIYHFNIFLLNFFTVITTFFVGILFCQFRKEWNSLIPGMIFHAVWNIIVVMLYLTSISFRNLTFTIIIFIISFIIILLFFCFYFKEDKNDNKKKEG